MAPKDKEQSNVGKVRPIDIDHEMQQAYLSYAMSVIVARALPDARDGLKPVHRRILYAMHDMGLQPNTAYKKSARIVGEVLGKYHPHGDAAVYDAMSRMAQDFSMRYLLVDGQGNFGSVDGDAPAAMRYTEARLASMSADLLGDIEKNTVDFAPNFDGTLKEPLVLPSAVPNLLVNGATGIAVGMATNIPPHNLGEVCEAIAYLIGRWDKLDRVSVDDLMKFVKGPDFPTGGVMFRYNEAVEGGDAIRAAYATGRGRVIVQAKAFIEDAERSKSRIIITELPYQVNKSSLIERIADLVRDGKIEGITDLRDESDRTGMRIIIELSRTVADPKALLGPALQAHAHAIDLRHHQPGAGRRRAAHAHAEAHAAIVRRAPRSHRAPPQRIRSGPRQRTRPHSGRSAQSAGQSRRSDPHHPPQRRCRSGQRSVDEALQAQRRADHGHPRHAAAPSGEVGTRETGSGIQREESAHQVPGRLAERFQEDSGRHPR